MRKSMPLPVASWIAKNICEIINDVRILYNYKINNVDVD